MRCDICNFDSNGNYLPSPNNHIQLEPWEEGGGIWLDFESGADITHAIARGCWICRTIRDALLPFNRYLPPEWHCKHDDLDILGGCKDCLRAERIRLDFRADPSHEVEIEVRYHSNGMWKSEKLYIIGDGIPWPAMLNTSPTPTPRIGYPSNFAQYSRLGQARSWLDRCSLEHSRCQQSSCSPKRLLEIRDTAGRCPSVRLYSPGNAVKYACLSYCWGQPGKFQTVADNLDSHFNEIYFGFLPKTIQDAVRICLALQIYYLWVDAFCIVQDDEDDWASECMRMGDIYSGAHVTLAAVQGHHSEAGLLHVKPFKVFRINVWPPTGFPTEALVYRQPKHSYLYDGNHLKQRPLFTRGWAYKQLLLYPIILRFDADELSFECREGTMCECGLTPSLFMSRMDFSRVENGHLSHSHAFGLWYKMVEEYSCMALTNQSDRLPAFSAIASKFSRYGGSYYAGIWEQDFISGLKWYHMRWMKESLRRRMLSTLTAPSWSWASMLSSVYYYRGTCERQIYSATISIKGLTLSTGANPFGGVSNGHLDAFGRGKFANLKVRNRQFGNLEQPYELCQWDGKPVEGHLENRFDLYFDGRLSHEDEERLISTKNSLCCFLLEESTDGTSYHTYSLILRLIDEKQGLYQRIGLMKGVESGSGSWFDDAEEVRILIQ